MTKSTDQSWVGIWLCNATGHPYFTTVVKDKYRNSMEGRPSGNHSSIYTMISRMGKKHMGACTGNLSLVSIAISRMKKHSGACVVLGSSL